MPFGSHAECLLRGVDVFIADFGNADCELKNGSSGSYSLRPTQFSGLDNELSWALKSSVLQIRNRQSAINCPRLARIAHRGYPSKEFAREEKIVGTLTQGGAYGLRRWRRPGLPSNTPLGFNKEEVASYRFTNVRSLSTGKSTRTYLLAPDASRSRTCSVSFDSFLRAGSPGKSSRPFLIVSTASEYLPIEMKRAAID
jgi:hypothetical protein